MISDEFLNLMARMLLGACSPLTAHGVLLRVGRLLPQRRSRQEVLQAQERLTLRGTCLSRALAIAATAPSAEVVIGVRQEAGATLAAHAWVEFEGVPLLATDPQGREIARLRPPSAAG